MSPLVLDVAVTLRSPFLFEGLEPSASGIDSNAIRDERGRPIIPDDHLRGHLSHALRVMKELTDNPVQSDLEHLHETLFGKASVGVGDPRLRAQYTDEPQRGRINVSDLVADQGMSVDGNAQPLSDLGSQFLPSVKIDDKTGAAEEGMLQVIELAAPPEALVTFRGKIRIRQGAALSQLPSRAIEHLNTALRLVTSMGAKKSAGYGEVIHETGKTPIVAATLSPARPWSFISADRLEIDVTFDRPLLVNSERLADNILRGSTVVPGAVIKGALAQTLADDGKLNSRNPGPFDQAFTRLQIGHAFPLAHDLRADRAIPDCLAVVADDEDWTFVNALNGRELDDLVRHSKLTPAFPVDWKPKAVDRARELLDRPSSNLVRRPRGHVAIGPQGVAEKAKLFVTMPVITTDRTWRFTIDFGSAEPHFRSEILDLISNDVSGIGRTGAVMRVANAQPATEPPIGLSNRYFILLETSAILTDPDCDEPPERQYENALRFALGLNDLKLVDHVARRRTAGGYLGHRFRAFGKTPQGNARYQSFEVTDAGAVFLVEHSEASQLQAKAILCARRGLPALRNDGSASLRKLDWDECPFVPENGYGAVSIFTDVNVPKAAKQGA